MHLAHGSGNASEAPKRCRAICHAYILQHIFDESNIVYLKAHGNDVDSLLW